jgi:excisionase family DNA binding protein
MEIHPSTSPAIDPTLLLTVAEAAAILKISRSKTYELIASGEIESVTIGRSRRIPTSALVAFVERRTADAASS